MLQFLQHYSKNHNLCLFRALALHLHGNERLDSETLNLFNLFLEKSGGTDLADFRGVRIEDIAIVEDIVPADTFLYDFDIVEGSMIVELARWVSRNTLIQYSYYLIIVTLAMSPIKMLSSKPFVLHRVIN